MQEILSLFEESQFYFRNNLLIDENALGRAVWSALDDSSQLLLLGGNFAAAGQPGVSCERRELSWAEGYSFSRVFGPAGAVREAGLIMPETFNATKLKNLLANKTRTLLKVVGKTHLDRFQPESLVAFLRQSILTPPPRGGIMRRTRKFEMNRISNKD